MFFHLIMTGECNSQCRYCYGEAIEDTDDTFADCQIDYNLPKTVSYRIEQLKNFCSQDPECVLTFYGGEPLLCIDKIMEIMDNVPAKHFMIQTNGLLLDRLNLEYVNRFHTILVSLDGDQELTDYYRGNGTFKRVVENLKLVRRNGYHGELIARMTVMEHTDIYRQVTWLFNNDDFAFSSVHWQLNAGFWNDFVRRDFEAWLRTSYNPGVRRLVYDWVAKMEEEGFVPRLYPFLGIADSFLSGEPSRLRCGGGWINYAIQTDGNIIICPTMWGIRNHYLGNITEGSPSRLKQVGVGEPCTKCEIQALCGGRCLYANLAKRWTANQYSQVCGSVRNLVDSIREQMPRIKELLKSERLSLEDFRFLEYNGCEIIP